MTKRLMCIIISVLMIVSLLPTGAFADSSGSTDDPVTVTADSTTDASGSTEETAESVGEEVSVEAANAGETYVASVGDTSYESIADAFSAANSTSGSTITLLADATASGDWTVSGTVTLDLAGHTLDMSSSRITISNSASLIINDTGSAGKVTSSNTSRTITVNGGTLTVNGGTIENSGTSGGWGCACIAVFGTNTSGDSYSTVVVGTNATLTTTGGSTTQPGYAVAVYPQNYNAYDCYGVNVTVSGTCTNAYFYVYGGITSSVSSVTINLTGAKITGQYGIYAAGYATWNITNTTITGVASAIEIRAGVLNVSGSTLTATSDTENVTTNWSGATVCGAAIAVSQHSTDQAVTVSVTDSTVKGYYGVLEVNCNASSTAAVSVTIGGSSTVQSINASGASVYSKTSSSENYSTSMSITGGTYLTSTGSADTSVGTYLASDLTIDSSTGTVASTSTYVATVTSNGTTSYHSTLADAIAAVPVGTSASELGAATTITILCDINNAEGISIPSYVNLTIDFDGHTYILTGPGAGSTGTETIGFQLLKDSTIVMKNGTVKIAEGANNIKRIIQSYANVTLTNMTFYSENQVGGEDYCLSFNNGSVNITGSTSVYSSDNSSAVIAFDVYYWSSGYPDGVEVTFASDYTGTIDGYILYDTSDSTKATLTINGNGTFNGGVKLSSDSSTAASSTDSQIYISGGTFGNDVSEYCTTGYAAVYSSDGTVKYTITSGVAGIYDSEGNCTAVYSSLSAAVSAATSGQTIVMINDSDESSTGISFEDKSLTLDLNGYDVTVYYIAASTNATLTIKDSTSSVSVSDDYTVTYSGGTLKTTNNYGVEASNGGTVTLESGKVTGTYGLRAHGDTTGETEVASTVNVTGGYIYAQECAVTAQGNGATAVISGGVMETADNAVVAGNGSTGQGGTSITISGGTLIGHISTSGYVACGIYHPQSGTLTITGGTIYADGGCGILMRGGTLDMSGGTIITTGSSTGWVGDAKAPVVDSSGVIYDLASGYYGSSSVEIDLSGSVVINAAEGSSAVKVYDNEEPSYVDGTIEITGGTYSSDVNTYCAEGYTTSSNEDGTYGITVQYAAKIGENYYTTLAAAFSAASDGDTITLLADVELDAQIEVTGAVTLDLNSHSVTRNQDTNTTAGLILVSSGTFTVQDTSSGASGYIDGSTYTLNGSTYVGYGIYITDGTVNVNSGTVKGYRGICGLAGTLNVSGGTVSGTQIAILADGSLNVNISDGAVVTNPSGSITTWAVYTQSSTYSGTTNISGGTIGGGYSKYGVSAWGGTVNITGGSITGASTAVTAYYIGTTVTISGEDTTLTGNTYYGIEMGSGSVVTVENGSITGVSCGIFVGAGSSADNCTTLYIKGGSINADTTDGIGVCTNGSQNYTKIVMSGGSIEAAYGMYLPAMNSETTISGGTIIGTATGIEIRAGSLTVSGDSTVIKSTCETFSTQTNGSGTTVIGAGIAISQHSTNQPVTVTITGGEISGYYGVYELNTYATKNSEEVNVLSVASEGSTSSATIIATSDSGKAIYSESVSEGTYAYTAVSISAGSFSTQVDPSYCADGFAPVTEADSETGLYTVTAAVATGYKDGEYKAYYTTLSDALSASADDIDTIKLVKNIEIDSTGLNASTSGEYTIDLNGYDLTIESGATLTISYDVTIVIEDSESAGLVTNSGTISVAGTLDIRDLAYTTDSTNGYGLLGQGSGKISLTASGATFIVPDVWDDLWSWTPNFATATSGSGIFSSAVEGAMVYCNGTGYKCTTDFNSGSYSEGTTYWNGDGSCTSYLIEYYKTSRGGDDIDSTDASTWTYPEAEEGYIFAGWYSDSDYTTTYSDTTGVAYAKFVKLFYDKTSETGDAAVINFIGGSLRKDSEDTSSTSLRFGYEIIIPENFDYVSWAWTWSSDDGSGSVSGQYYSTTTTMSNEDIGSTVIRTNLVLTGIPSSSYTKSISTVMIVTLVTGDGTTVTITGSECSRSVDGVASAIKDDEYADDDDKSYASSIYEVTHGSSNS